MFGLFGKTPVRVNAGGQEHPLGLGNTPKPGSRDLSGRNTPTGVGKTWRRYGLQAPRRKHPHGRGEDLVRSEPMGRHVETPPRAWGRLLDSSADGIRRGNTPTGVGKTGQLSAPHQRDRKHPHGRGEDDGTCSMRGILAETPPRAWGRQRDSQPARHMRRNTPTGVGKTGSNWTSTCSTQKHPHGRGEDSRRSSLVRVLPETPPRAWGRLVAHWSCSVRSRNTPTGVGKTSTAPTGSCW